MFSTVVTRRGVGAAWCTDAKQIISPASNGMRVSFRGMKN